MYTMNMATVSRCVRTENLPIDRRRACYLVLDTETVIPTEWVEDEEKRDLGLSVPYDFGGAVVDKQGNVYASFSVLDSSIFFDRLDLMQTCFFANKRQKYLDDLMSGKRDLVNNAWDVRDIIKYLCDTYNIKAIVAHNMRFDHKACKNAMRFVGAKSAKMFPYDVGVWDTLTMAWAVYGKNKTYKKWCQNNGYLTARNQIRMTAEILYRYITNQDDFEESHTALEDVLIEKEILAALFRSHKKMRKTYWKEDEKKV